MSLYFAIIAGFIGFILKTVNLFVPLASAQIASQLLEIIIKHFVTFRTIFIDDTFADDTFANDTLDFEGESQCMNASD
jgi:hypothetical protein